MESEIAIGIDLGTTNSCVAIYRNNKVDILENEMGKRTTPSWVTFTKDGILTGPEAVEEAHKHPKTAVYEAKRLIGQKFADKKVKEDIQRFPFTVFNDLGSPKIRIELDEMETIEYYPEDISAYILQRMKKIAETRVNETITRAVITVPAYFNDAQRQATKDAATIAGFKTVNIINEPTAAALAFDHENKKKYKRNILVFDFGGGTFDVSVVNVGRSLCKVIATKGDSHLGGTDIDSILANELRKDYQNRYKKELDPDSVEIARRLKHKSEAAKISLSGDGRFHFSIEMDQLCNENYTSSITRARLENLSAPLFSRTIDCVSECLKGCNLDKSKIDEVVLVGGSSRIPKVQELIRQYFGDDKINQGVNPDEAVAYGAAIYAANLTGADKAAVTSIIDVTSLTIGTNVEHDKMSPIIPRNTPLPATETRRFQTVYDNQATMDFPIFQGESINASENILLGEFTMKDLTEAPAKAVKVEIKCHIDIDGILTVSAKELNTNNSKDVVIDVQRCGLTNEQIQERIRDAEINNERTRKRLQFDEEKHLLQQLLSRALEYAEGEEIAEDKKDTVLDKHDDICKWLESAKVADIDKLVELKNELTSLIK